MRVAVLSFGSNWWARSESRARRFARYNSSGIACGRKMRRHWIIPGVVRFNGMSNFSSWPPQSMLGGSFLCSEVSFACGGNRLLFLERIPDLELPQFCLLTINDQVHGRLDLSSRTCRSGTSIVLAASELRQRQEIMLLVEPGGWLRTSTGFWQLRLGARSGAAEIVFVAPPQYASEP